MRGGERVGGSRPLTPAAQKVPFGLPRREVGVYKGSSLVLTVLTGALLLTDGLQQRAEPGQQKKERRTLLKQRCVCTFWAGKIRQWSVIRTRIHGILFITTHPQQFAQ